MLNYTIFLSQLFATEVEWSDLSQNLRETYKEIVTDDFEYEFVKATPNNDFWSALDIKAADVVEGYFWMYEDGDFTFFNEDDTLNMYTTAKRDGLFEYFNNFTKFQKWLNGSLPNNEETIEEVKKAVMKRPLPNLLNNAINTVFGESEWNSEEKMTFMNDVNINLDVFCVFEPSDNENFECQAQIFFKKSNGKTHATNILKVKKADGQIFKEGFGDENTIDFDFSEPVVELTPEEIEVNRVTEAILQPGASESNILAFGEQSGIDEPEQVVLESVTVQEEVSEPSEQQTINVSELLTEAHESSENPRIVAANIEEVFETTGETEFIGEQRTISQQEEEPIMQQESTSVRSESVTQEQAETVTGTVETHKEKKGMSGWLIALIVVSCVVISILAIVFVRYMFADRK